MPAWVWTVIAGLVLAVIIPAAKFVIAAIALAIVQEINGSLGLDELRADLKVAAVERQEIKENQTAMQTQVTNLERQLEAILTDI